MKVVGVIPARFKSTRFPGKVLAPILGKPMVQHVWERVQEASGVDRWVLATDSDEVAKVARGFGAEVAITSEALTSGTDRVAEAVDQTDAELVVNVQGDEPLVTADMVSQLVKPMVKDPDIPMATLRCPIEDKKVYQDPNVVKVQTDGEGWALDFSRKPDKKTEWDKHLGFYAYRRDFLKQMTEWKPTEREKKERLEQLRVIENGGRILTVIASSDTIGVDTPKDVTQVEAILGKNA